MFVGPFLEITSKGRTTHQKLKIMKKQKISNFENSGNISEIQPIYKTKVKQSDREKITSSNDAFNCIFKAFNENTIEYLEESVLLLLNRKNEVLGWVKVSQGGTAATVIDSKVIFAIALQTNSSAIILAHNHPSGNLNPSKADIQTTKKIVEAGKLLDLQLLDHLIVTPEKKYFSLADNNLM